MKSRIYTAFGLILNSEINLPELLPASGQADVRIVWGKVPDHLENPIEKTPWFEIATGEYLLRVDGVAKYYAENGNNIIIEPFHEAKVQDIRVFLLNTVLAALLHQRDYLVLHGSTAVVEGKAVAIIGPSQKGKTTIALSFYDQGYQLLGDEICAIKIHNNKAVVFPGIPQLNAWHDSLVRSGKNIHSYQPLRTGINKYVFPVHDQFEQEGCELDNIVILQQHNQKMIDKKEVKGGTRFQKLLQYAYFMETVIDKSRHFQICATVVKQPFFFELTFNDLSDPVNLVADVILKELK